MLFTVVLNEPACNTAGIYSEILGIPHPPRNAHFHALLGHQSVKGASVKDGFGNGIGNGNGNGIGNTK